jgi:hypothetical protein
LGFHSGVDGGLCSSGIWHHVTVCPATWKMMVSSFRIKMCPRRMTFWSLVMRPLQCLVTSGNGTMTSQKHGDHITKVPCKLSLMIIQEFIFWISKAMFCYVLTYCTEYFLNTLCLELSFHFIPTVFNNFWINNISYTPSNIIFYLFIIKPTRCTNFTNLIWHETLHVSDSSSVHHQEFIHCTLHNGMSYRFVDSFRAGPGWN